MNKRGNLVLQQNKISQHFSWSFFGMKRFWWFVPSLSSICGTSGMTWANPSMTWKHMATKQLANSPAADHHNSWDSMGSLQFTSTLPAFCFCHMLSVWWLDLMVLYYNTVKPVFILDQRAFSWSQSGLCAGQHKHLNIEVIALEI